MTDLLIHAPDGQNVEVPNVTPTGLALLVEAWFQSFPDDIIMVIRED